MECDSCGMFPVAGESRRLEAQQSLRQFVAKLMPLHMSAASLTLFQTVGCDRRTGPCYNSQSRANYDLCEVCRSRPEALVAAPYCRRHGTAPSYSVFCRSPCTLHTEQGLARRLHMLALIVSSIFVQGVPQGRRTMGRRSSGGCGSTSQRSTRLAASGAAVTLCTG